MDRHPRTSSLFLPLIALIGACLLSVLSAQDSPAPSTSDLPDLATLKTRLESAEAAATAAPDDPAPVAVRDQYLEAVALLEQAAKDDALAATYRDALASAPEETKSLQAELDALPPPGETAGEPAGLPRNPEASVIAERLTQERAGLAETKNRLTELEKEIADQKSRPEQIRERKLAAQRALDEAEAGLAAAVTGTDPTESAEAGRILLLAKERAAQAELAMLEQEALSSGVRANLVAVQHDLTVREVALGEARVNALTALQDIQSQRDVDRAAMAAEKAGVEAEGQAPAVQNLAKELADRSAEFESVAAERAEAGDSLAEGKAALERLTEGYERLKTQLKIGGVSGAFGQIILEQSRRLPNLRRERGKLKALEQQIGKARLGAFQVEEDLSLDLPAEIERILGESAEGTDAEREQLRGQIEELLAKRSEVLENLNGEYQRLIRDLGELDLTGQQYVEKIGEVRAYLEEKQIWVRSADIVGSETITGLPRAFAWLFAPSRGRELAGALTAAAGRNPFLTTVMSILLLALLVTRRRCKAALELTGQRVKRVSTDRYAHTLKALLLTAILALPLPLLVFFLARLILEESAASDWLRGLGGGLVTACMQLIAICFALAVARSKGLGQSHFGWEERSMRCFRRNLRWTAFGYVPATVLYVMLISQEHVGYVDNLGRVLIFLVLGWSAFFLARMLHPARGIFAELIGKQPPSWLARFSRAAYPAVIVAPILLAALAAAGYPLTAIVLIRESRVTIAIIFTAMVIYEMLLRWFTMRGRKLALAERLREWKERAEAAAAQASEEEAGKEEAGSEETVLGEVEEEGLDFVAVGEQTRRLLSYFVFNGVIIAIWFSLGDVVPAFRFLDRVPVGGGVSLAALILGGLIGIATVIGVRNLPGILEVAVLRHLDVDAGARYAATTLARYAIITIGVLFIFNILELDWSRLGWILTALSVGLGFGLQETVANFVCGIILLFERPVRIGDVVTVAGTTGTVSRIRIRATTITNWDRQEFIVPNKEFVTGTLLNWTLSSSVNRVVIAVGVAYSSDTLRVRELIKEIIAKEENVLDDPEPRITFDEFGDSTLNFTIRAYIPNLDHRLATIDSLHHAIHRRFGEEGIEIAFPQRDLHLRSVDPSIQVNPPADPAKPAAGESGGSK